MTPFKTWMKAATVSEQETLASRVGTSRPYLYVLSAGNDAAYGREPAPTLAAAIERETKAMARSSGGRLPIIYRTDLVAACRNCEFAQRCLGRETVIRGEFQVVTPDKIVAVSDSEGGSND